MQPSELIVSKSVTLEKKQKCCWEKTEFSLKVSLEKNDDPEQAKIFAETLIDSWLRLIR